MEKQSLKVFDNSNVYLRIDKDSICFTYNSDHSG